MTEEELQAIEASNVHGVGRSDIQRRTATDRIQALAAEIRRLTAERDVLRTERALLIDAAGQPDDVTARQLAESQKALAEMTAERDVLRNERVSLDAHAQAVRNALRPVGGDIEVSLGDRVRRLVAERDHFKTVATESQARERALRAALRLADDQAMDHECAAPEAHAHHVCVEKPCRNGNPLWRTDRWEAARDAALAAHADDSELKAALREHGLKTAAAERAYFRALCLGEEYVPASATLDEVKAALREFGLKVAVATWRKCHAADDIDGSAIVDAVLRGEGL